MGDFFYLKFCCIWSFSFYCKKLPILTKPTEFIKTKKKLELIENAFFKYADKKRKKRKEKHLAKKKFSLFKHH